MCAFSPRDIPPGVPFVHARRRTSLTGTMVKSHVECSPDLTWALVQKANVFVRRSRSATRQKTFRSFSAETNNLTSLHTYKHSGACASRAPRLFSAAAEKTARLRASVLGTAGVSPAAPGRSRVAPRRRARLDRRKTLSAKTPTRRTRTHRASVFPVSGLAHAGVGIKGVADKNPTAAVMTVGDKATSVKGIFQQQAKTVANLCAAARPDLTVRRKRRSTRSFITLSFAPRAHE